MKFADMENFHLGYQFFMTRASRSGRNFLVIILAIIMAALIWAVFAQMDDVVRAQALLRPVQTISIVRTSGGGQALEIRYAHGEHVEQGDLLLRIDVSTDELDLKNSRELMARISGGLAALDALLETVRSGTNAAPREAEEAFLLSRQFLLENRHREMLVEDLRLKLESEKRQPELSIVRMRVEEMERELARAELALALWVNTRTVETADAIRDLTAQKESLERRMADLETGIAGASIRAPISGRVSELRRLNPGDVVVPGEEILAIVPEAGLRADLYIEPAHIARVRAGQTAVLSFPGLPPSRYGKLETKIDLIPADFSAGPEGFPVFVVEATLERPWIESPGGGAAQLRAGIGAQARIVVDRDTVLRMLLRRLDFLGDG